MIAGILLAAGRSSRFGADKRLHALSDGTPMALASLQPLHAVLDYVIAVVRPHDDALAAQLTDAGARVVTAQDWASGMGRSLARGVAALDADTRGCLVALADMPYVRSLTVMKLARRLDVGASLVAPSYCGSRGHPVAFVAEWFPALCRLSGDRGARDLLAVHRARLTVLEVNDPGVLLDVDFPEDLARGVVHARD